MRQTDPLAAFLSLADGSFKKNNKKKGGKKSLYDKLKAEVGDAPQKGAKRKRAEEVAD